MTNSDQNERDSVFWIWFVLSLIVIIALNVSPFFPARRNFQFDAWTTAGLPFEYHWFGGIGGTHTFLLRWFLADIVFAFGMAYLTAWIFRFGWKETLHRFQCWGLDDISESC